jgi:hypothetical protein
MHDDWEILPNGLLTKESLHKLKEEHRQAINLRQEYLNAEEYKNLYQERDQKFKQELERLIKARLK